jgi:hypothetical protein
MEAGMGFYHYDKHLQRSFNKKLMNTFRPTGREECRGTAGGSVDCKREGSVGEGRGSRIRVLITNPGVGLIEDSKSAFSNCSCSVEVIFNRLAGNS